MTRNYFYTDAMHVADRPGALALCGAAHATEQSTNPFQLMSLEWAKIVVRYEDDVCLPCKAIVEARWMTEHGQAFQAHSDWPDHSQK